MRRISAAVVTITRCDERAHLAHGFFHADEDGAGDDAVADVQDVHVGKRRRSAATLSSGGRGRRCTIMPSPWACSAARRELGELGGDRGGGDRSQ